MHVPVDNAQARGGMAQGGPRQSGIGSIHVNGPSLRRMRVAGGQFFIMCPLAKGLWW
jgi:hypothetical protein